MAVDTEFDLFQKSFPNKVNHGHFIPRPRHLILAQNVHMLQLSTIRAKDSHFSVQEIFTQVRVIRIFGQMYLIKAIVCTGILKQK